MFDKFEIFCTFFGAKGHYSSTMLVYDTIVSQDIRLVNKKSTTSCCFSKMRQFWDTPRFFFLFAGLVA
jgi:hypothetical protein